MNTKESIKFIESRKPSNFTGMELNNVRTEKIIEDKLGEVVECLQRGGEYEQMWEKFKENNGSVWGYGKGKYIRDLMSEFEEKYFPKKELIR
ncbi:hypothetical protein ES695_21320 [Candidatus Atribacteria bacterium 1244-E10-H5-B2]|nr:MAG: hypothetical protein ES695_21320 [Candidatus Atribacteria bacterium 1244-E10-H5-B2]